MRQFHSSLRVALASLLIAIPALLLAASPAGQPSPPGTITAKAEPIPSSQIDEQLVAEAPPGSDVIDMRVTGTPPDRHIAWVTKRSGRRLVWLDGKPLGTYDEVKYLAFRGKDHQLTFVAIRDSKWALVANGKEYGGDYTKITEPDVGPSGTPSAGVCRGKVCRLLLNGTETGPAFEDIGWPDFAPGGERYIYFGKRNQKWIALVDGNQVGPEMDGWWTCQWFPDGKRVAVAGLRDDKYTWIADGQAGPPFDVISDLAFSPDHEHYAFGGASATSGFKTKDVTGSIVIDGKPVETGIKGKGIAGHWTWMMGQGQSIKKGVRQLSADFHGVSDPSYTATGELVFAHRIADGQVAVRVGNHDGPAFEDVVSPIVVNREAGRVAYIAKRAGAFVEVRDQAAGVTFPAQRSTATAPLLGPERETTFVSWIHLMPEHLAYVTVRGGGQFKAGQSDRALRRLVLDGVAGPEYDAIGLRCRVNDTGQSACVVVGADKDRDRILVNGRESKLYDEIVSASVDLSSAGGVNFIARQDRRILDVTVRPAVITTQQR